MKLTTLNSGVRLTGVVTIAFLLFAVACSQGEIALIEMGISAGEAIAEAVGVLPPGVATYIDQAEQAFGDVSTELAAPDTTVQKAQDIHTELAALVLPDLTGLSAADQQNAQKINTVITELLAAYPAATSSVKFLRPDTKVKKSGFSKKDLAKLKALAQRAQAARVKLLFKGAAPLSADDADSVIVPVTINDLVDRYTRDEIQFTIAKLNW